MGAILEFSLPRRNNALSDISITLVLGAAFPWGQQVQGCAGCAAFGSRRPQAGITAPSLMVESLKEAP